ncbi:MAG: basic amino acid ABC transporter substrate-binding protein [Spirochaetaceae bacterium]|nr:MAG: basic amino acid ABC transporter substrate-binding protein [Spirochaetaceae bacterium]
MKRLGITLLVLTLIAGFAVAGGQRQAADPNRIVVATDATWPPMQFINEQRELVGFDIDLMRMIAEEAGLEVEFRNTAWDGIFAGLAARQYDAIISSVTITEERRQTMDFSIPYINAGQVLIVRENETGVTTLADLRGRTAGAQIGTTGAFEIQAVSGVELRSYDELGLAIEDLALGRIDGVVADTPIAADFVLQNENYRGRLKIVGEPFTQEFYGIAVQKGNSALLDRLNAALQTLLDSGRVAALEDQWLR